jgi:hypothetical protein
MASGVPQPSATRYERPELQAAYEDGFRQEYDHDSFVLLDRFAWILEDTPSGADGAERMAAVLEGAADALRTLAKQRRDQLPALRRLDSAGS